MTYKEYRANGGLFSEQTFNDINNYEPTIEEINGIVWYFKDISDNELKLIVKIRHFLPSSKPGFDDPVLYCEFLAFIGKLNELLQSKSATLKDRVRI